MHEEATDKITYTLGSMIYSNEGLSETQYYVPCVASKTGFSYIFLWTTN